MKALISIAIGGICLLPSIKELKASSIESVTDAGGRIVTWSENPWFLENTSKVEYCIEVDKEFGLSKSAVRPLVRDAFKVWKNFFAETVPEEYKEILTPYNRIKVGTQTFVEEDCSDSSSIRFQFGFLTDEQQQVFQNPRQFIGAAVRTEYDTVELRSKGFVYIASLTGANAPYSNHIATDAYSDFDHPSKGSLALKVNLIHEIGHIFGLKHSSLPVMEAKVPHAMISKDIRKLLTAPMREATKIILWHFLNPMEITSLNTGNAKSSCEDNRNILTHKGKDFFGVSKKCHHVSITFSGSTTSLEVKQSNNNHDWEVLYQARTIGSGYQSKTLVSIVLPENQKVFSALEQDAEGNKQYFYSAENYYSHRKSSLSTNAGTGKPVILHATTGNLFGNFDMTGSIDNRVESLMYGFNWGSVANDKMKLLRKAL